MLPRACSVGHCVSRLRSSRVDGKMGITKRCFVPKCANTSKNNPQKIFITVPRNVLKKRKWFTAIRRELNNVSLKTVFFCCEDHFNLAEDMENYYEYKLSNEYKLSKVQARMKPDIVPHVFSCHSDKKTNNLQLSSEIRCPKREKSEILNDSEIRSPTSLSDIDDIAKVQQTQPTSESTESFPSIYEYPTFKMDFSCQANTIRYRSKAIQVSLKTNVAKRTMSIDGQRKKILQTLRGHTSDVTSCDFAPNFTLVTGSIDKTVRIWDWRPGSGYVQRSNSPLRGHKYQVTCVRVSPQGSMLASSSVDGTAVLWNLHSCAKLYTMTQVNGDAVRVCRFSPDSSIFVTAGDNGAVCVWDLIHRSLIKTLFEHEGTTQSLAFTPDSQYLVTACSLEVVRVWHVQDLVDTTTDTASPAAKVDNAQDMGVFCVDISKHIIFDENNPLIRQYKLATSGNTNEIKLWTITSKSVIKHKSLNEHEVTIEPYDVYDGHSSSVTCIKYSNNGTYLVSSSLDKLIKIWDNNGACIATLEGHNRYVNCVAISRDSSLVVSGSTGSNDKLIIIWDLTGNMSLDSELFHRRLSMPNTNGHELHLTENNEVNANEVTLLEKIDDVSEGAINSCCFFQNDLLATGSGDKLVRLFKVNEENNNIEEVSCSPLEGHTYAINHVEFSTDGSMLASCSLDGCTIIWNTSTGERYTSMPKSSLSVKVCKFSPACDLLLTAGDDEKLMIWDICTLERKATLEGHLDSVTSASFSPDGEVIISVSFNADFRIWSVQDYKCIYVKEDAHEYGIQSCDVSQNLEPIPNMVADTQSYLLATCGNDSLVKLWRITIPKQSEELLLDQLEVKLWRSLQGHGGNVICVRFSKIFSEFLCSTATDRQARIWSVYSTDCLYVLDHDSLVTSCAINSDCSLLVTGCLDKTLWLWKLPQQLVFQTAVANKIHCRSKTVIEWTTADVVKWLKDIDMKYVIENVKNASLNGEKLLTLSEEVICSGLDLDEETTEKMSNEIRWLKKRETQMEGPGNLKIPHEYLCPITHEIMREPVTCSDGFTYEKNAIAEWFMSGKFTSPMTNEVLSKTDYLYNLELRNVIHRFLDNSDTENE